MFSMMYLCADGPLAGQVVELPSEAEGLVLRGGPGDGTVYKLENEVLYWQQPEEKDDGLPGVGRQL